MHSKGYKIDYREKNWLSKILLPPANRNLDDFKISVKDSIEKANVSIKHDHNTNGSLVKDTAYKVYYSRTGQYIITNSKNVKEIAFKEKEDPKDTLFRALCKFKDRDIKDEKLIKKLKYNSDLYEKIQNTLSEAKQKWEQSNQKTEEEGKTPQKITDVLIYKTACSSVRGQYIQCDSRFESKFFVVKKPTEIRTGFGYDTGDNLFLDLYHDKTGKLCGEIIRKIDFNKNKIPNYQKGGYALFERIYRSDTLEADISEDKISLKNKTGSVLDSRTFVKVKKFTELSAYSDGKKDQIQIFFGNLLKSNYKDSFCISSMQKYNVRKVILTSLGIIKYRSQILKNREG
jgi:CRISPR-associated endonuclease Csn1